MRYYTHLALALLFGLIWLNYFSMVYPFIFLFLVMISGLIPDLDMPNSKLGKKIPILPKIFNLFFGHRGFVHSLFIPLILLGVFLYFDLPFIAWGIFVGNVSHLVGDLITKEGISPLYPLIKFRIHGFIKTGKMAEHILFVLICFACVYLIHTVVF